MNRRTIVIIFAAFLAPLTLWAQDAPVIYRITSVEYHVDGKTRERPLREKLEIKIGQEFADLAALEAFVADKRQVLINQRVLEFSDLTYTAAEAVEGVVSVTLVVQAKDTWNLIVLPYPKYTTNDGFLLGLRLRDYNFIGSMEVLQVDFDYRYDENYVSSLGLGFDFELPFDLAGLEWAVGTDQSFAISGSGLVTYTDANTLKLYLRGDHFLWTLRFGQNAYWNADAEDDDDLNKLILQTLAGISTETDIFSIRGLGPVTLTPDLVAGWKYLADGDQISEDRRGPYLTASYTMDTGRADWIGNFREGLELYFKNAYTYNFLGKDWDITALAQARYYTSWADRVGLNSRITLYGSFLEMDEDIGGYIRGVPDVQIDGDFAAFVNFDLPIRLFEFKPSLLIRKDWFDFDVHASPFVDAALVNYYPTVGDPYLKPYLAGGLEVFGFLKRARSIYARVSVGVNALGYLDTRSFTGNYELFFGLGHEY